MTSLGPLHLEPGTLHYLYELPFLKLILAMDSSKIRPFLVPYGRTLESPLDLSTNAAKNIGETPRVTS